MHLLSEVHTRHVVIQWGQGIQHITGHDLSSAEVDGLRYFFCVERLCRCQNWRLHCFGILTDSELNAQGHLVLKFKLPDEEQQNRFRAFLDRAIPFFYPHVHFAGTEVGNHNDIWRQETTFHRLSPDHRTQLAIYRRYLVANTPEASSVASP